MQATIMTMIKEGDAEFVAGGIVGGNVGSAVE
jgi:hypothetical protein